MSDCPWLAWFLSYLGIAEFAGPIITVTFRRSGDPMSLAGTVTVTLSAPDPKVSVAKRPIVITVGSNPAIDLDGINGPVTFPCNEGDKLEITAQDITAGGVASPLATVSVTAVDTVTVPASPTISVSFVVNPPTPVTPMPTPTPAPAAS
jgi:hypothetical protein